MSEVFQPCFDFTQKLPPEVQERIRDGMAQADRNANPEWRHIFDCCVLAAARKKATIVSDDVLTEVEALGHAPTTHNLAAIGGAMRRASQMGILQHTNEVKRSERPNKHGNRQNVWVSNYYSESVIPTADPFHEKPHR